MTSNLRQLAENIENISTDEMLALFKELDDIYVINKDSKDKKIRAKMRDIAMINTSWEMMMHKKNYNELCNYFVKLQEYKLTRPDIYPNAANYR